MKTSSSDTIEQMLALSPGDYALLIAATFEQMDRPTRAHVLVAKENLNPMYAGMKSAFHQEGERFSIEDLMRLVEARLLADDISEIGERRWSWTLLACMIKRLELNISEIPEFVEIAAVIWCHLADAAPLLKGLLPHNIVWSPEEKEWFDLSLSDDDLTQWTLNIVAPKVCAKHPVVQKFAQDRGLWVFRL
ncbi:MAG: hypothetical protein JY451_02530 [Erythrobacter sp.]|nr:MAG: hypothetical protein JY451_02530 [Erythrobacter sp.]